MFGGPLTEMQVAACQLLQWLLLFMKLVLTVFLFMMVAGLNGLKRNCVLSQTKSDKSTSLVIQEVQSPADQAVQLVTRTPKIKTWKTTNTDLKQIVMRIVYVCVCVCVCVCLFVG